MGVELDHVEAFVAIVQRGGFTRASADLHLSQPAISRRIRLLETELGAPVFERVGRSIILTDAGHAFLPHAEALLASMRDGIDAVRSLHETSRGSVTLALVGTLADSTLTARLRQFRQEHPGIDLRLCTARSREVSVLVLRGDAALGLRYAADANDALVSTTIHEEPLLPVCAPDHPLTRARRIAPHALARERWITFPPSPDAASEPYTAAIERQLAAFGLDRDNIVAIDSLTAQKRMAEAGFGIALLPASSVTEELRTGTLRTLHTSTMQASIPVVLIQRRRAYRSRATRSLEALLTAWP